MSAKASVLFLALALAAGAHARAASAPGGAEPGTRVAIATCAADEEQLRAVRALARSIRERGGAYSAVPIYAAVPDPGIIPAEWLKEKMVEVLPLEMERSFLDYPLAIKAFAAAQVEKRVAAGTDTLIWLDPGAIVLKAPAALDLGKDFDAAVRPVTLANTIGIPPLSAPNDYWQPIYRLTGLDYGTLSAVETVVDEARIQPYFNCEVFSLNPRLGLAAEWARLLGCLLKDETYQKSACTSFLRRLFLHQAALSAVIASRVRPERIKALPLTSGYPFSQHGKLPAAKRISSLDEATVIIFDRTWQQDGKWLERIPVGAPLRDWLRRVFREYLRRGGAGGS